MSIKIRLARAGRKGIAFYKVVATNSTSPRDGKFLEKLGTFDPLLEVSDEKRLVLNRERVEYWISVGATPTDRLSILLNGAGIKGAEKYKVKFTPRKKGEGAKKKALEAAAKAAAKAAEAATSTPAA